MAIKHRTTLDASHRMRRPNSEAYLKSPEEMAELFRELPEASSPRRSSASGARRLTSQPIWDTPFPILRGKTQVRGPTNTSSSVCRRMLVERYGAGPPALYRRAEERLDQEFS